MFKCIHKKTEKVRKAEYFFLGPKNIWVSKSQTIPITFIIGRKRVWFKLVPKKWVLKAQDEEKVYVPRPKIT